MRDWRKFLPASFKGFRFETKSTAQTGARAIPVHEYVRSESHDTEDMGRKAGKLSVTAYLASDTVDAEATAFFTICTSPGAGLLTVPDHPPGMYRCTEVKRSQDNDTMGKIAFELSFVEAGGGGSFVLPQFDLMAASSASALSGLARGIMQGFNR